MKNDPTDSESLSEITELFSECLRESEKNTPEAEDFRERLPEIGDALEAIVAALVGGEPTS